jgi:hypothetical protein
MKDVNDITDIEVVRKIWDDIIDYEKSWCKVNNLQTFPVAKLIHYFGAATICKLYGCTIYSEELAKELVRQTFLRA